MALYGAWFGWTRTAKPNTHYGSDAKQNFCPAITSGKGKNEKYFTLVNKETGMVEMYNNNSTHGDKLIGTWNPESQEVESINPNQPKWQQAAFGNADNPAVKNIIKCAEQMVIREVYNDASNLNSSVSEKNRKALANKIAKDLLSNGTTAYSPTDDPKDLENLADDLAAELKETMMEAKGRGYFPNLRYPEKMSEDQDAIKFTILEFQPREWDKTQPGVLKERDRSGDGSLEKIGRGSVVLPMPSGLKDNNQQDWGNATMNPLQAVGAQLALAAFESTNEVGSLVKNVANDLGATDMDETARSLIAGQVAGIGGQLIKRQGALINPNVELLFNAPMLRNFSFTFNLSPRNPKEAQTIKQIIRTFKQASAPRRTVKGYFLRTPLIYQISYINNEYNLNRFKECAMTSFQTDYTPNGNYSTFRDGTMTQYKIQMTFSELDPVFNDDYDTLDESSEFNAGFGPLADATQTDAAGIGY